MHLLFGLPSIYSLTYTRRHNLHLFVSSQDHRVAFWHTTSGVLRFSLMLEFKSSVPIVWKGPHHMFGTFGWLEKGHKHLYKDIIPFDQMNHINFKCQYNGQSVTSGLKYQVMQIFGQSSLSIPNITSKFWQTDIFKPKFGLFFTFSKSAFKYWADLTITVFALHKCTGAQGLKVLALSEKVKVKYFDLTWRGLPEKADPRPGCSPERGAQSWCGGRLQVAPVTLLQAPLYVPLLGTRHRWTLQHCLHVPYLWKWHFWGTWA